MTEQFVDEELRLTEDGEYAVWMASDGLWLSLQGGWVFSRDEDDNLSHPPRDLLLVPAGSRIVGFEEMFRA